MKKKRKKDKKKREFNAFLSLVTNENFRCSHGINYLLPCRECGKVLASILLNKPIPEKKKKPLKERIKKECLICGYEGRLTWECPNRYEHLRNNILKARGMETI